MYDHIADKQLLLGASMYVPTTQEPDKLVEIGNGQKFPELRSVIFCTEDAVRDGELPQAMRNIEQALPMLTQPVERPLRFIRARNPSVLGQLLVMRHIDKIDGFVLPKVTAANFQDYVNNFTDRSMFHIMPTLETAETFDCRETQELRTSMLRYQKSSGGKIVCVRVGGNDLLNCLNLRHPRGGTIYDTPVGGLICRLAGEFIPFGIGLTGPVFESFSPEAESVLRQEVELDLQHGLFGKTAIHPSQISVIEDCYRVSKSDLAEAESILRPDAPAVFKMGGRMCEPTTHKRWAQRMIYRAQIYNKA